MTDLMLTALQRAEAFMAGFEGDETQDGLTADLATIRTAIAAAPTIEARARALLAAVDFDNSGNTIGLQSVGGNGGLISLETTKAADALRLALDSLRRAA